MTIEQKHILCFQIYALLNLLVIAGLIFWLLELTPKQHPGYKPVQCLYMQEGTTNLYILMP